MEQSEFPNFSGLSIKGKKMIFSKGKKMIFSKGKKMIFSAAANERRLAPRCLAII